MQVEPHGQIQLHRLSLRTDDNNRRILVQRKETVEYITTMVKFSLVKRNHSWRDARGRAPGLLRIPLFERQTPRVITACPKTTRMNMKSFQSSLAEGCLPKFYNFRTVFLMLFRKRITATGIASDNILQKPDKDCESEEKRAAFHSARAAVKLLPSKICAWKIKDNISRLRLMSRGSWTMLCALTRTGWKRLRP